MSLTVTVALVRLPRGRCPACSRRRVLFALAASSDDRRPVAAGRPRCAECAGLRAPGPEETLVLGMEPDDAVA